MATKAKQSKVKPNSPEPKEVNVLARSPLTKEEKERLEAQFELMRPQIAQVFELVHSPLFEYQANLAKTIKELTTPIVIPSIVIAEQMSGLNNLFKDALRVHEMQKNLIEQSLAPMREFQESIKQATALYQNMFKDFTSPLSILSGLVVDISFTKSVITEIPRTKTVYYYDETNSTYNLESNQLQTPLIITKESEAEKAILAETKQINIRFGLFQKEVVEENHKLMTMLKSERADKKLLLAKIDKLEKMVMTIYMDGQTHEVQVSEVKPNSGFTKLLVKMSNGELREVYFGRSKLEVTVLRGLYDEGLDEYEIITANRLDDITGEGLTKEQMVDAADRINQKVFAITHKKEFIKIILRKEIQLNPDF